MNEFVKKYKSTILCYLFIALVFGVCVAYRTYADYTDSYDYCVSTAYKESIDRSDILQPGEVHPYYEEITDIRTGIYDLKREECSLYYQKSFSGSILEAVQNANSNFDLNKYILENL